MATVPLEVLANQYVENIGALVRDFIRQPLTQPVSAEQLRADIRRELLRSFEVVESLARDTLRGLPAYQTVPNDDGEGPLIDLHQALTALGEPEPPAVQS